MGLISRVSSRTYRQKNANTMLPLSLLKAAQNSPMLVELKNGETYNGILVSCDNWMNISLKEVICTSRDGQDFHRMNEAYIRGSIIKYLRIPDDVIKDVRDEVVAARRAAANKNRGDGGHRGGRGGGHRGGRGGGRGRY